MPLPRAARAGAPLIMSLLVQRHAHNRSALFLVSMPALAKRALRMTIV